MTATKSLSEYWSGRWEWCAEYWMRAAGKRWEWRCEDVEQITRAAILAAIAIAEQAAACVGERT
jgi:hypothetical protein